MEPMKENLFGQLETNGDLDGVLMEDISCFQDKLIKVQEHVGLQWKLVIHSDNKRLMEHNRIKNHLQNLRLINQHLSHRLSQNHNQKVANIKMFM